MKDNEIRAEVKEGSIENRYCVFIDVSNGRAIIEVLLKSDAETIAKRINTDVEKMVREMMEEYARKMIGIPHTPDYHMALQEVINRIEEGKCVDL